MQGIKNVSLDWSGSDVEAFIDPIIEPTAEESKKLQGYFNSVMEDVFSIHEHEIIEFINSRIMDHIYYNKQEIKQEIEKILKQ